MPPQIDLTGRKFGRLTVLRENGRLPGRNYAWLCLCSCGKHKTVDGSSLRRGATKSCGCLQNGSHRVTHGMSHTPEYAVWQAMLQRCRNPNNKRHSDYGGRGITICKSWERFEKFISDMGLCPKGLTLERRDNDKGYSPDNCYWATRNQQQRNMRMPKTNTSGIMGVSFRAGKYEAKIRANNKSIHLGRFKTIEEARNARRKGEVKYWKKGK